VLTYVLKAIPANRVLTWILKYKWFVNNMGSHNVRTHWMHHVRILRIGLKMVHRNRNMLTAVYWLTIYVLCLTEYITVSCGMSRNNRRNEKRLTNLRKRNAVKNLVQATHVNWTTQPLPNCQYKWTMISGPLGHSRAASTQHSSSTCLHKHRIVHL